MIDGWAIRPLDEITQNFDAMRVPVKEADRKVGPYPYYGASGIVDHIDQYIFDGEYLLIAEDGENLRTQNTPVAFLAQGKFWVNNHAHIVRGNEKADTRFLLYSLLNADISGYLTGSTMPKLTQGNMNRIPVLTPPLSEQRAIAHILSTLDDKIELNRRMNETLEALARAIFKSWFVDFDPVRARMEGRQPVGMDAETAALFPTEFEDSALGQIPKGWKVRELRDVVGINEQSIKQDYPYHEIEYIDISSVATGKLEGTTAYHLSAAPSRAQRLVSHGDTIWSCVRPNRKSYLFVHQPLDNLVVSTGFAVLSPKMIPPTYLYAWVTADEFVDYLSLNADGSAYPAVRAERFGDAEILLPSDSILSQLEHIAGSMRNRINYNERESRTLAALRNTLLPKLLSGEVRIEALSG